MSRAVNTEGPQQLWDRAVSLLTTGQVGKRPTPSAPPSEDFKVSSEKCTSTGSLPCPEGAQSMYQLLGSCAIERGNEKMDTPSQVNPSKPNGEKKSP